MHHQLQVLIHLFHHVFIFLYYIELDIDFQNLVKSTINTLGVIHYDGTLVQNNLLGRFETDAENVELSKLGHVLCKFGTDEVSYLSHNKVRFGALGICVNSIYNHTDSAIPFTLTELKHNQQTTSQRVEDAIRILINILSRKPIQVYI